MASNKVIFKCRTSFHSKLRTFYNFVSRTVFDIGMVTMQFVAGDTVNGFVA